MKTIILALSLLTLSFSAMSVELKPGEYKCDTDGVITLFKGVANRYEYFISFPDRGAGDMYMVFRDSKATVGNLMEQENDYGRWEVFGTVKVSADGKTLFMNYNKIEPDRCVFRK